MIKTLPTLYKLDTTGKMRIWNIRVEGRPSTNTRGLANGMIIIDHGVEGGEIQHDQDLVTKGKNQGKKNETTPFEQACAEAQSKWEKQISKKGYVEDRAKAANGEHDFKGGEKVMLAQKYWDPKTRKLDRGHKIVLPVDTQPKLDGHRCDAKIVNGVCTLWSRGHEEIVGVPHINRALEAMFPGATLDLDGELYNHEYHDNFEELSGFITSKTPKEGHEVVQYHVYDVIDTSKRWVERKEWLDAHFVATEKLVRVPTRTAHTHDEIVEHFEDALEADFEGLMLRNHDGGYVGKRTDDLQKVKTTDETEFRIVNVEEGRGKMKGLAIFVCVTPGGREFNAKKKGALKDLRVYFEHPERYIGKMLTVEYQGYYKKKQTPRFPRATHIREEGF